MLTPIEGFADSVVAVRGTGLVSADDYRAVLSPAISRATASASGRLLRAFTTIEAPPSASVSAIARPILRLAPVMSAVFPSSLMPMPPGPAQ